MSLRLWPLTLQRLATPHAESRYGLEGWLGCCARYGLRDSGGIAVRKRYAVSQGRCDLRRWRYGFFVVTVCADGRGLARNRAAPSPVPLQEGHREAIALGGIPVIAGRSRGHRSDTSPAPAQGGRARARGRERDPTVRRRERHHVNPLPLREP
jgi:hypothetical protein